jgi:hypothetical protein
MAAMTSYPYQEQTIKRQESETKKVLESFIAVKFVFKTLILLYFSRFFWTTNKRMSTSKEETDILLCTPPPTWNTEMHWKYAKTWYVFS